MSSDRLCSQPVVYPDQYDSEPDELFELIDRSTPAC